MSGSTDVDALLLQVRKNAVLLQVICFFEMLQFKIGLKYVQGVRFCKAANDANSYERITPFKTRVRARCAASKCVKVRTNCRVLRAEFSKHSLCRCSNLQQLDIAPSCRHKLH